MSEALSSDSTATRVTTGLAKIGIALRSHAWHGAGELGLTPTQGQLMGLLSARADHRMRVQEVADELGVRAPTASDAVATLCLKGLVVKAPVPGDRRGVAVVLTNAGRQAAEQVAMWPDFLLQAVDVLTEQEQAVFLRGLVKMIQQLQRRGQIPVARMCTSCQFFRPHVHADPRRPHHCAFVDAPFGDSELQVDCPDHEPVSSRDGLALWDRYTQPDQPPDASRNN